MTRITATGTKTRIEFTTLDCTLAEKIDIQNFFKEAEEDSLQRKIQLEYWNDEKNTYETGYFYRDNPTYKTKKVYSDSIDYAGFKIVLVEY